MNMCREEEKGGRRDEGLVSWGHLAQRPAMMQQDEKE